MKLSEEALERIRQSLDPPTPEEHRAAVRIIKARSHFKAAEHIEGAWGQDLITEEDREEVIGDSPEQARRDHKTLYRQREYERLKDI